MLELGILYENEESAHAEVVSARVPAAAIDLVESRRSVEEIAADLGVSNRTFYDWWNQHSVNAGRKPGMCLPDNAEMVAARRIAGSRPSSQQRVGRTSR